MAQHPTSSCASELQPESEAVATSALHSALIPTLPTEERRTKAACRSDRLRMPKKLGNAGRPQLGAVDVDGNVGDRDMESDWPGTLFLSSVKGGASLTIVQIRHSGETSGSLQESNRTVALIASRRTPSAFDGNLAELCHEYNDESDSDNHAQLLSHSSDFVGIRFAVPCLSGNGTQARQLIPKLVWMAGSRGRRPSAGTQAPRLNFHLPELPARATAIPPSRNLTPVGCYLPHYRHHVHVYTPTQTRTRIAASAPSSTSATTSSDETLIQKLRKRMKSASSRRHYHRSFHPQHAQVIENTPPDVMLISNDYMRGISSLASSRLRYLRLYTFDHLPEYDDVRFVFDSAKNMGILDVFLELEELRFWEISPSHPSSRHAERKCGDNGGSKWRRMWNISHKSSQMGMTRTS
ncbi:hypothetical protein EYR36_010016 [Pleurotus pulmonarius]|nr:hypothetical protein EYR36_010016 [Pleurotus pulmonarius]